MDVFMKYLLYFWYFDVLELCFYGWVFNFDFIMGCIIVLMKGLVFVNGIVFFLIEDFFVVCESWKYWCVCYWLEGEFKGMLEIFIDNLLGLLDNIYFYVFL